MKKKRNGSSTKKGNDGEVISTIPIKMHVKGGKPEIFQKFSSPMFQA
jgi:hypothetical protein